MKLFQRGFTNSECWSVLKSCVRMLEELIDGPNRHCEAYRRNAGLHADLTIVWLSNVCWRSITSTLKGPNGKFRTASWSDHRRHRQQPDCGHQASQRARRSLVASLRPLSAWQTFA